ncbi:MAG: hypothetical protein R2744_04910 [Bacteroidales bacterium]
MEHGIPVYRQKTKTVNLHPDDLLNICQLHAEPLFTFEKGPESSLYELSVIHGKKSSILEEEIDIICNSPCIIGLNDDIIFIDGIEGTRLGPFLTKKGDNPREPY